MASKAKANQKGQGQVLFAPGTRHSIPVSLSTLTRAPLALPVSKGEGLPSKKDFILDLLTQAGAKGITWQEIRQALIDTYGKAPQKKHSLYQLLEGLNWNKTVGQKGVVTYSLRKAKNKRK